jgi:AcrR family transcriptional regulator
VKDIDMSTKTDIKKARIIECALELLCEQGDKGLTMRQVAVCSKMSLSNVQYYFKNRDALLVGLIDYYLKECNESYDSHLNNVPDAEKLKRIISLSIGNSESSSVCNIFKELWAIADRNPIVKNHLNDYYKFFAKKLTNQLKVLAGPECADQSIDEAVSLILPLIEGYSITKNAIPLDTEGMITMITNQVMKIIGK